MDDWNSILARHNEIFLFATVVRPPLRRAPWVTGTFPRGSCGRGVTLTTRLYLVPRLMRGTVFPLLCTYLNCLVLISHGTTSLFYLFTCRDSSDSKGKQPVFLACFVQYVSYDSCSAFLILFHNLSGYQCHRNERNLQSVRSRLEVGTMLYFTVLWAWCI
jgi:hypothetical protein